MITESDIAKYRSIYREKFGIELTTTDARNQLQSLLLAVRSVHKRVNTTQLDAIMSNINVTNSPQWITQL